MEKTKLRFSKINFLLLLLGIVCLLVVGTQVLDSSLYALFFASFVIIAVWAFLSETHKNSESDKELKKIKDDIKNNKDDIETLKKEINKQ